MGRSILMHGIHSVLSHVAVMQAVMQVVLQAGVIMIENNVIVYAVG